ncbi:MAG: hypothetical protein IJH40_02260 [Ruminococcus sp.]|uniref:hypothetical protein n=1 Tax=Ruminococcus sp. TaxID=41978 RepID=UPI002872F727|nr:hypothetical protein [Ruminococcus sp.]MBQ3284442.1 hypothetical protein [Ruminococcus sp.]
MTFPNAKKGVNKIFTGEILMLIAAILTTVSSVALVIVGAQDNGANEVALGASAAGLVIFSVVSAVLMAIALVFSIIGVFQSSKDEPMFKGVIFVMLLSLAVVVVSAIFTESQLVIKLSDVITSISSTITTVLIVIGIGKMAEKLGDDVVFTKGQTLLKIIIWIALLTIILRAIAAFTPNTAVLVIEVIMLIITGLLEVIQYFLYLSFLSKSKKMLQNAN